MIKNPTEGGIDVVAVLKDVLGWSCDTHSPKAENVPWKGVTVKYRRAFIGVGMVRRRNEMIRGTGVIGAVSAVDTYTTLAFADGPLEGAEE